VAFGETVEFQGPGVLAFDGERERVLQPGQRVRLSLDRSGPRVIDVQQALRTAAASGHFCDDAARRHRAFAQTAPSDTDNRT
jgi:hypothetical protein